MTYRLVVLKLRMKAAKMVMDNGVYDYNISKYNTRNTRCLCAAMDNK